MHVSRLLAGFVAAVLLAGCSGDGGEDEVPPIGGEEPAAVETDPGPEPAEPEDEPVDITVVPDEITEEYVEAVLAELERIRIEALDLFRDSDGEMTIEVSDRLSSAFAVEDLEARNADFRDIADRDFEGMKPSEVIQPPGVEVVEFLSVQDDCVWVETMVSLDETLDEAPEPFERLYLLIPKERELVEDYNPTPWVIAGTPADVDEWREVDPCAAE